MGQYRHHVSGFFTYRNEAEDALTRLLERGIPRERLYLYDSASAPPVPEPKSDSNAVLKDVLVDGAIGTAVGTGLGALAQLALVAGNISLFVASPLIAPLAMLGWGAGLGGFLGASAAATAGAGDKEGKFSDLVHDAIANGQIVLIAETLTEQETADAKDVIKSIVGDYSDTRKP